MSMQDITKIFIDGRVGRLMKMEENEQTRFQYETWFEYTRQTMTELKEGTLLAVKNFSTNQNETHYSILEIVSIMPVHYALGENPEGYPGFVMEAARNIATDWTSQEDQPQEDTTIIRCIAMPTGIEITESAEGIDLSPESALPMIGVDIRVLTNDATRKIINREISPSEDHIFEGGKWLVNDEVPIFVRAEDFVKVHFGIFGFTGVGKSNLVSTYIADLLNASQQRNRPVKIVLFDLMGEYTVLLIDKLLTFPQAWVLGIGEYTFPGSVVEFLSGDNAQRKNAINHLISTTLYPKPLERIKNNFEPAFMQLLNQSKIRLYQAPTRRFRQFLRENENVLTKGNLGGSKNFMWGLRQSIIDNFGNQPLSPEIASKVHQHIDQKQQSQSNLTNTATNNIYDFLRLLEEIKPQRTYPTQVIMTLNFLIDQLNNPNQSSLIVIQAHDPDELRNFSNEIGWRLYENRRRAGITKPLVSFVFDEADEFIPLKPPGESYQRSARIAETLARRGRKFGIGVGICTQRVRYLQPNVMAQPHTYLISKMPRKTDRDAIQEAFGFSEEMLRQTFKFAPGDWLLASHDATGLKAVPIPIHAQDANERIRIFLKTI